MSYDVIEAEVVKSEVVVPRKDLSRALTRQEREELKALSKEIFGVSSKYEKFYVQKELIVRKTTEIVPGENGEPDTMKDVEVPVSVNGVRQWQNKYRTTEEVLQLLQEFKAGRDAYAAQVKLQEEEAKAKEEAAAKLKQIQEDFTGSAV